MKQQIASDALKPGDKLPPEAAIMDEFGVSRTVVREAHLAAAGGAAWSRRATASAPSCSNRAQQTRLGIDMVPGHSRLRDVLVRCWNCASA